MTQATLEHLIDRLSEDTGLTIPRERWQKIGTKVFSKMTDAEKSLVGTILTFGEPFEGTLDGCLDTTSLSGRLAFNATAALRSGMIRIVSEQEQK